MHIVHRGVPGRMEAWPLGEVRTRGSREGERLYVKIRGFKTRNPKRAKIEPGAPQDPRQIDCLGCAAGHELPAQGLLQGLAQYSLRVADGGGRVTAVELGTIKTLYLHRE